MNRVVNFANHTVKVFYITVIMGATVNFELPQLDPYDNLIVNNPYS